MIFLLKYIEDLWSAQTIDIIINKEISPLTSQKGAFAVVAERVRLIGLFASLAVLLKCSLASYL